MFENLEWKDLFRLPSRRDLGMSNRGSRKFSDITGVSAYEDKLNELYPVRYFLAYTLPKFVQRKIIRNLSDFHYYIKCHVIPSHRFHILDLRQPHSKVNDIDYYSHGWMDVSDRMLLANFTLLSHFVEGELDSVQCPSLEEIAAKEGDEKTFLLESRKEYFEIVDLYRWWKEDRKIEAVQVKKAMKEDSKRWIVLDKLFNDKEEEMLIRLIKIRNETKKLELEKKNMEEFEMTQQGKELVDCFFCGKEDAVEFHGGKVRVALGEEKPKKGESHGANFGAHAHCGCLEKTTPPKEA